MKHLTDQQFADLLQSWLTGWYVVMMVSIVIAIWYVLRAKRKHIQRFKESLGEDVQIKQWFKENEG